MTMTVGTDTDLAALAGDPAAVAALAGHAAAELAAMQEAAAAFLDRFAGGRGIYGWPPGQSHHMLAANVFATASMPVPDPARRQTVRLGEAEDQAARLAGTLWQVIAFSGGIGTQTHRHFPTGVDAAWLPRLPLPTGQTLPTGQSAGLLDGTGPIERHLDPATLAAACAHRPRTRVFEDIGHGQPGTWAALTAQHLTRLAGGPRVTCSVFESAHGVRRWRHTRIPGAAWSSRSAARNTGVSGSIWPLLPRRLPSA